MYPEQVIRSLQNWDAHLGLAQLLLLHERRALGALPLPRGHARAHHLDLLHHLRGTPDSSACACHHGRRFGSLAHLCTSLQAF